MVKLKNEGSSLLCPACGGSDCVTHASAELHIVCPKCSSERVVGIVRERSLDLALVGWTCAVCMHEWSASCVLPEKFVVDSIVWRVYMKRVKA